MTIEQHIYEDSYIKMWFQGDIFYGEYKKDVYIDLPTAQFIVQKRIELCGDKNYPAIGKFEGKFTFSKEARDFVGTEYGNRNMTKLAIMTPSTVSKTVGNWYLTLSKPYIPTRLFTNEEEAIKWLKE